LYYVVPFALSLLILGIREIMLAVANPRTPLTPPDERP
jgi:hypothetical protein